MDSLNHFTEKLIQKNHLDSNQIAICINQLISNEVPSSAKEDFLHALYVKGESPHEIAAFIESFRKLARDPGLNEYSGSAIDLCGTGGDKSGSFNISTFVSFIIASSGMPVIKHGNRSISSKCGSADLIEAVGIPLVQDNSSILEGMKKLNFAFLFAPSFHPAFKHIAPVRKEMGNKGLISIFNILGPLINPASPSFQILGVYSKKLVSTVRESLDHAGQKGGFVLHGIIEGHKTIKGVDELTPCGRNIVEGFGQNKSSNTKELRPEDFGLSESPIDDLKGGDLNKNIDLMNLILEGNSPKGLRNSILMNCALAFLSAEKVYDLGEGVELAEKLISDGLVTNWLDRAKQHFN